MQGSGCVNAAHLLQIDFSGSPRCIERRLCIPHIFDGIDHDNLLGMPGSKSRVATKEHGQSAV